MTSLNRREFFECSRTAGLSLAAGGMILANANPVRANPAEGASAAKKRLRDVGYVWEGQPAYRDFPPSMYGLGEGCAYFGLRKAYYLYHGNNAAALSKLAHLEEVLCDISIWRYRKVEDAQGAIGWGIYHEKSPDVIRAEADTVSRLSLSFPNVRGAMLDDLLGAIKSEGYAPDTCVGIRTALQAHNPRLQVCSTVYTHELDARNWTDFDALIDVVFLWVWKSEDLVRLDEGVARCREIFPGKPIVLGCYLSDYTLKAPVPMDRLRSQWERIPGYLEKDLINGFCILGAYLIDHHPEQATWVRDFIAGN